MTDHPEREPDEAELPDKPPIQDMPDEAGDPPTDTEEFDVPTTFMPAADAWDDPTVDDEEDDAG